MRVLLSQEAARDYAKINEPTKSRVKRALVKLSEEPPDGDIKKLQGRDGYRIRIGGWRILFDIIEDYENEDGERGAVVAYKISTRGDVYKGTK